MYCLQTSESSETVVPGSHRFKIIFLDQIMSKALGYVLCY